MCGTLIHSVFSSFSQVKTSRVYVRDCTVVAPLALLLFGGELNVLHEEGAILVDGWLRIPAPAATAVLVSVVDYY